MRYPGLVVAVAFLCCFAASLDAQTVRNFIQGESGISSQGSKVWLVFENFDTLPTGITLGQGHDPEDLYFDISYPTYGNSSQRVNQEITCRRVVAIRREIGPNTRTILVCHLDGDIHNADEVETSIPTLPEGWAVGTNEETGEVTGFTLSNGSAVDYPKAITTWDMVPHQIYEQPFHVDLVVFHRYSFEHSKYGDFDVDVWIDEYAQEESAPPGTEPKLVASARPSYKVPQRNDMQAGTYMVYRATFDPAEYIEDSAIVDGPAYIHFKITPSRGDADSILVSRAYADTNVWRPDLAALGVQPNIETMKIFLNGGGTLPNDDERYAVVDPVGGNDTSGNWYADADDARADAFRTIFRAVQAMPADLAKPVILLRDGTFWPGRDPEDTISGDGSDKAGVNWLTIMPDSLDNPPITRDQVEITDVAFIVSSSAPGNALFSITNDSGGPIQVRWRGGTNEGFEIDKEGANGFPVRISRTGKDVDAMVNAINTNSTLMQNNISADPLNFTGFSVDEGDLYYDDNSAFLEIADEETREILANSVVRTGQGAGENEVHIFSELDEEEFTTADADDMLELKDAIELHYDNMEVEVIHNVQLETLQPHEYRIPAIFPNQKTWFEADLSRFGLRYPFVRYQDCTIRSVKLVSEPVKPPDPIPHHLWIDHSILKNESKVSVDSGEITAIPDDWDGGTWFTGCDFNTMRQSTNGSVMVRDAHFIEIGGDTGKQVSYAMNWLGENVAPLTGDLVHPDYFQWSPDKLVGKNAHGNIIAVNLDFRDVDNDGQPFLLNVPGNDNTSHTYTGVALVNLRMNAARTQQICGDVNHFLLWNSDVFQGSDLSRRVHLRGVPQGAGHTSVHHNISIRNTVCENLRVNGASGQNLPLSPGDVPSLWAIVDSSFIIDQLLDEFEELVPEEMILTMHDSFADEADDPGDLIDGFPSGDWSPFESHPGEHMLLVNRLMAEDIVYRMDASGTERRIDAANRVGASGAMEHPDDTLYQPSELDSFSIDVGTQSPAVLTNNPLADLVLSDDQRLHIGSAGLPPVVELVVETKTAVSSPATIDLVFEGRLTTGTINDAQLALWNWDTETWANQGSEFTISTTESVKTEAGIAVGNFVDSETGRIRYRVQLAPLIWPSGSFTLQADQMKVVVKD